MKRTLLCLGLLCAACSQQSHFHPQLPEPSFNQIASSQGRAIIRQPGDTSLPTQYVDASACSLKKKAVNSLGWDSVGLFRFAPNSAQLNAEQEAAVLAIYARIAGDARLLIVGHADAQGRTEHNLKLSLARAQHVADRLIGFGMDRNQVRVLGLGETAPLPQPAVLGAEDATSRRVDILIYRPERAHLATPAQCASSNQLPVAALRIGGAV